jgi:hypothetical protein
LKHPWSGQSKTGSMQIFDVHEFGPPSSELAPPLSGKVNGGNMKPLLDPELDEAAPVSSSAEASSEVTEASSDDTEESSELEGSGFWIPDPPLEPPVFGSTPLELLPLELAPLDDEFTLVPENPPVVGVSPAAHPPMPVAAATVTHAMDASTQEMGRLESNRPTFEPVFALRMVKAHAERRRETPVPLLPDNEWSFPASGRSRWASLAGHQVRSNAPQNLEEARKRL